MDNTIDQRRQLATERIKAKHGFQIHLVVYLTVNAMLVLIWTVLAAGGWSHYVRVEPFPNGFFWPIFPIAGWGVAVAINGHTVYRGHRYTEQQIQQEMNRLTRQR